MRFRLSKAKLKKRYTFEEARSIPGPFVYALEDDSGIFYVGKTIHANSRFYKYISAKTALRLQRRVRDAVGDVRVRILMHNPPDLIAAELEMIKQYASQIVNTAGLPMRPTLKTGFRAANRLVKAGEALCPICENQLWRGGEHACKITSVQFDRLPDYGPRLV